MIKTIKKSLRIALECIIENCFIHAYPEKDQPGSIDLDYKKLDNDKIEINITDYGPGITDEIKNNIFEPFYTTKFGKEKRIGLGMYIAYSMIQNIGGVITVMSDNEKTTFKLLL